MWRLVVALCAFLMASVALAAPPGTVYDVPDIPGADHYPTVSAASLGFLAWAPTHGYVSAGYTMQIASVTSTGFYHRNCQTAAPTQCTSQYFMPTPAIAWCTGSNTAPDTTKVLALQCPDPNPCADQNSFVANFKYGSSVGTAAAPDHVGVCVVVPQELLVCRTIGTERSCWWQVKRTGVQYTGPNTPEHAEGTPDPTDTKDTSTAPKTTTPPVTAPPEAQGQCPRGTVQGGFDSSGTPICFGVGSAPKDPPTSPKETTSPKTTTQNPDGSTTQTQNTTYQNSDGSTTIITTTIITQADGTTETTKTATTTHNPATDAPGVYDGAKDDEKYDLCKQHPELAICTSSSVTGSCGSIACTGDAIQCATLRAAALMQCQQDSDLKGLQQSTLTTAGGAILTGADPQKAALDAALKGSEIDVSAPVLDQTGFASSSACLGPRTWTVNGQQVTMNFELVCTAIQPFRYVVLGISMLVAYLIVSKSVLHS